MRKLLTYVLALTLALSGGIIAHARGASHDVGFDIVICSGIGVTVITIGPDGEPIEKSEPCPDGIYIFADSPAQPTIVDPAPSLLTILSPTAPQYVGDRSELAPSARGPPTLI